MALFALTVHNPDHMLNHYLPSSKQFKWSLRPLDIVLPEADNQMGRTFLIQMPYLDQSHLGKTGNCYGHPPRPDIGFFRTIRLGK